jgi:hypothetical protein
MRGESFKIENESEADEYLTDLLATPQYRSMNEVQIRAQKYIADQQLRNYFIAKARAILEPTGQQS